MNQPKLENIELISTGWLNKYKLTFALPNGDLHTYETISRRGPEVYGKVLERLAEGELPAPDAVSIVPILPDGSLLMIREFRYPLNQWCISFPAGLVDRGEDIRTAVERELSEETGYHLAATPHSGHSEVFRALPQSNFSTNGVSEESVWVVFVDVEPNHEESHPDRSEFIEPFILPQAEIQNFLADPNLAIGARCQLILAFYGAFGSIL